jgi:arachidonate 15-lipoxygenase
MSRFRGGLWNALHRLKFRATKPLEVPVPTDERKPIRPVPLAEFYRRIPIADQEVANRSPKDEFERVVQMFCDFQAWLARVFSPMRDDLPTVDTDPYRALAAAYPVSYQRHYRPPARPLEYGGGIGRDFDLGAVAVASPYACYLTRAASGSYQWDLTSLDQYECHAGVLSPAVLVEFTPDLSQRRLDASRIDCELGVCKPGDPDWDAAQRLAMCAVSTHVTLARHFNWLHLVCGGPLAIATDTLLPTDHPVRRLLRPHLYNTHFGNRIVTRVLLEPAGDFPAMFSFTHRGMCALFESTAPDFDIRLINPDVDAVLRDIANAPFELPAHDNRRVLMSVMRNHVLRYLAIYYASDEAIRMDEPLARWLEQASTLLHNGVTELTGSPVTLAGAAEFLSTIIYLTTVEHEIVDSNIWDYQLWSDVQPVRMYRSGRREPIDVYQRLVNYNFVLNVSRTPLMSDFSSLALDPPGAEAFRVFRNDLEQLQRTMNEQRPAVWRIEPRVLEANMNY